MSLLTTIQASVKTAKKVTEPLWQSVTYKDQGESSYDTVGGVVTQLSTDYSIEALITKYDKKDLGEHVLATDLKAMVVVADLSPTPSKDDTVVYNGTEYSIVDFQLDVSQSIWYLQLR